MVWETIGYDVGRVQLNPCGGESFGLTGIFPSVNQHGDSYSRTGEETVTVVA